jgi:histidinol-phosphate aminotransferase
MLKTGSSRALGPASPSRRAFASRQSAGLAALAAPRLATGASRAGTAPVPAQPAPAVIALDSNENPYGPSPRALAAMTRSQAIAARYPDAREREVVETLARLHDVAPEQVALGCGSGEVLKMADAAFLGPDKRVVVAEPTFEAVLGYAKATNAEPVKVPLTADHRHDLAAMAKACDARTGLVYVCNPNNPTATIVGGAELLAFLKAVPRETVVLVDEAYHHFVEDPAYRSAFTWLAEFDNLVVVRTFSKIYGLAGMRLGYAVASREKADALRAHALWSNGNAAVLDAALASLEEPEHAVRQRALLNGTRRWLCEELRRDGRRFIPSEANFVMIEVGSDVTPLIEAFRARGIRVGRRFPALPGFLRISIGTDDEMRAFLAGLRELAPLRAAA